MNQTTDHQVVQGTVIELPQKGSSDIVSTTSIFLIYLATLMTSLSLTGDLPASIAWAPLIALLSRFLLRRISLIRSHKESEQDIIILGFALPIELLFINTSDQSGVVDPMGILWLTKIASSAVFALLVMRINAQRLGILVGGNLMMLLFHMSISQSLLRSVLVAACFFLLWLAMACRHPTHLRPGRKLSALRWGMGSAAWTLAVAAPLMVAFFVLFPRLPLDAVRNMQGDSQGSGSTGLSSSMTIGSISELRKSTTPAFDVVFSKVMDDEKPLYWRGVVLDQFNGMRWTSSAKDDLNERKSWIAPSSRPFRYTMTWSPETRSPWVVTLDGTFGLADIYFDRYNVTTHMRTDGTYSLSTESGKGVMGLPAPNRIYSTTATAALQGRLGDARESGGMPFYLSLPAKFNPKTLAFGKELRAKLQTDENIVNAVLARIHNEEYRYTLKPPKVGKHSIDDFLFETRAGFCEYYAGAFVVLMRAAGIPARVVTGYMSKPASNQTVKVLQSDAHAWAEVWMGEKGWMRYDPTSVIHPSRIDPDAAGSQMEIDPNSFAAYLQFKSRRLIGRLDMLWREHMTHFDQGQQARLFEKLGLDKASKPLLALSALIAFLAAGILWQKASSLRAALMRMFARRTAMQTVQMRLEKLGLEMTEGQTWRERLKIAIEALDETSAQDLAQIVAIHEWRSYTPDGIGRADLDERLNQMCRAYRPKLKTSAA